ncbi:MAG: murein biosynthesis integral membrane protein MurJ [Lentisphaerae bacterium RIFOXYC12_FULL_60_16]|nr:MAG: murein biosynthesis integral membrane protein MurJ [Lentisphaerae bacterium RIFOXYC12_FULL_60_16]
MKSNGTVRFAALVGGLTLLSRILGVVRQILMGALFGTSLFHSAFVVAFRIPNLFRRLFGEGALSAALIPVYAEVLHKEGSREANVLAARVMILVTGVLLLITGVGMGVCELYMRHGQPGIRTAAVIPLLQIMLPYGVFICLVALCMAVLNSNHRFGVPAFTPVLLNLIWIAVLIGICPWIDPAPEIRIRAVAWGILSAGIIQLMIQYPALKAVGFNLSWPRPLWGDARLHKVLMLMGPVAVGMGAYQLNVLIDGVLALWVAPWAPAALSFAELIVYLPLGLFGTSMGTVLLPAFSHHVARSDLPALRITLQQAIRVMVFFALPASIGLTVLAEPVIRLLYEWKGARFDAESTIQSARALLWYAPGIVCFGMNKLWHPVFYAMKDPVTPIRIGLRMVGLNFVLNLLFIITWPDGYRHAGLAAATTLTAGIESVLLAVIVLRRVGHDGFGLVGRSLSRMLVAGIIMGVVIALVGDGLQHPASLWPWGDKAWQLFSLSVTIGAGITVYVLASILLCRDVWQELRGRHVQPSPDRSCGPDGV